MALRAGLASLGAGSGSSGVNGDCVLSCLERVLHAPYAAHFALLALLLLLLEEVR